MSTSTGLRPPRFGLVTVAASAGGLQALRALLGRLPEEFGAPMVVAQHRAPGAHGYLDRVLGAATRLRVHEARDGDVPRPGHVHVGPADQHVRVAADGVLRMDGGPRVNFARPSADPLFASVAAAYGARALGVVLTGRGRDGAAGAAEIRRRGGLVLAQDPATCEAPSMPQAVLSGCGADFVLPLDKLADALVSLVMAPAVSTALFGLPVLADLAF
ncbi:chemotaxis protein CheB [Longimicrobium sp.]|uniref:chemotaxis protein CheB n=1 Tax=Longimicrobium sp. TaxID=2029185 RepID=UPI002E3307E5|nr:chemotaxis protein CheB [Longimicrobium sp.]HEX6037966.1 chemotaxis protein CheB [Longimicrobium sp.]